MGLALPERRYLARLSVPRGAGPQGYVRGGYVALARQRSRRAGYPAAAPVGWLADTLSFAAGIRESSSQ
jgi:hypothetical protein